MLNETISEIFIHPVWLNCRFDGWGIHDCERTEAAGVQCKPKPPPTTPPPTTTTPRPTIEIHKSHGHALKVRLFGGRDFQEGEWWSRFYGNIEESLIYPSFLGRVEVQLDENGPWGPICGDGWGVKEAMVRKMRDFCIFTYFGREMFSFHFKGKRKPNNFLEGTVAAATTNQATKLINKSCSSRKRTK